MQPARPRHLSHFAGWWGYLPALVALWATISCAEPRLESEPLGQAFELLSTIPENGALAVSRRPGLSLCFSTFLDPRSVTPEQVSLTSGVLSYDLFIEHALLPYRDPWDATKLADQPWCPGSVLRISPRGILVSQVRYRLQLAGDTLRAWTGEPLRSDGPGWLDLPADPDTAAPSRAFFLEFVTGIDEPRPNEQTPGETFADLTLTALFHPGKVFDRQSQACSCHQDPSHLATGRLDLRTPDSAARLLGSSVMPTGFPMVAPREPASSYLIQKLVRQADGTALPHVTWGSLPYVHRVEYARLAELSAWIAAGARP